ncbi:MAG: ABC transporter ATP-binding protein [Alphaproteobacteria bacterium]|nr:ABC transporter ATP-binding protein [Alphaproteobacteria bacterium]
MGISVSRLSKAYGTVLAVNEISFEIGDGEFVSLLGPSGCGKTTTLRCIAGLEDATGGEIRIGERLVSAPAQNLLVPAHERQIGMVFQSYAVWPHMTVRDNVGFPLSVRGMGAAQARTEVEDALRVVGLAELAGRHPSQLSGGQQQRVALARAIVGSPRVLLFDEPLSNLDAKLREGMRGEIRRLQRRLGIAAVYVTHDREEALSMSDRVIVMDHGRIVQIGTPQDLYRRPASRFVADFVGKVTFVALHRDDAAGPWLCPDGTPIALASTAQGGTRALAAIRPEDIRVQPGEPAGDAAADGANRFAGTIAEAHYTGPVTEYLIEAAGGVIRTHAQIDLEPGARVTLSIPPDRIVLLPPD